MPQPSHGKHKHPISNNLTNYSAAAHGTATFKAHSTNEQLGAVGDDGASSLSSPVPSYSGDGMLKRPLIFTIEKSTLLIIFKTSSIMPSAVSLTTQA